MQKKELRLIGVAIIIGALAVGAYFYSNSEESPIDSTLAPQSKDISPSQADSTITKTTSSSSETPAQMPETKIVPEVAQAPYVDPLITQQEELLKNFKNKIRLDINLPSDMRFDELDLDADVAAMQGNTHDRKLAILAAPTTASPQVVASFLQENKSRIPMLGNYDFKISGDIKSVPAPKNSGISKISVIPGGEKNGSLIYAALIERSDKKGTYLFLMEGTPSYFENYEGDLDNMLSSLSAK